MAGWLGGRGQASGRNHRLNLYEFFAREEVYRARGNIQPTAVAYPLGSTIVIPAEGNLTKAHTVTITSHRVEANGSRSAGPP